MKTILLVLLTFFGSMAMAQDVPAEMITALRTDDSTSFVKLLNKENINGCHTSGSWQYSVLSMAIRSKAKKCFDLLIAKGADVNKSCNGYVPPLMHAAKYGSLEMVKTLVAKGANLKYVYEGEYAPANGKNPIQYAGENNQPAIAEYLKNLKK